MRKIDFSNTIAAEMNKALEDNKSLFSTSSMLEKLAFKKVSDENQVGEVEAELDLKKVANDTSHTSEKCCECDGKHNAKHGCECDCHPSHSHKEANIITKTVGAFLKISEDLDTMGFDRLAAASILLADKLIAEAKVKSSPKSKSEDKSKSSTKSKSSKETKKMDMKDRMKKMREMKGKKKDTKKVSKAQAQSQNEAAMIMQKMNNLLPKEVVANLQWRSFDVKQDVDGLMVVGEYKVLPAGKMNVVQAIKAAGATSLPNLLSATLKAVDPRIKNTNVIEVF